MAVIGKNTKVAASGEPGALIIQFIKLAPDAVWEIVRYRLPEFLGVENKPAPEALKYTPLAGCVNAVGALAAAPKEYLLRYDTDHAKRMGVPSNLEILLDGMVAVNADVKALRDAVLQAKQDVIALDAARGVYNHIVEGTSNGSYGEKLTQLQTQGYVVLMKPHRGFISSSDGPDQFGMSYRLGGRLPGGYPRKLVLHVHCTATGEVRAASIKYEDKEKEKGDGLPLEPASFPAFRAYTFDKGTAEGLLPFN